MSLHPDVYAYTIITNTLSLIMQLKARESKVRYHLLISKVYLPEIRYITWFSQTHWNRPEACYEGHYNNKVCELCIISEFGTCDP